MPIYGYPRTALRLYGGPGLPPVFPLMIPLVFTLQIAGPVPADFEDPNARQDCRDSNDNIQLLMTVVDQNMQPVNLRGSSSLTLRLRRPSGTTADKTPALLSNGIDGVVSFVSRAQPPDFDQDGRWELQLKFVLAGKTMSTRWAHFWVGPNIDKN